jgi:TrmH family RNA methyltransferase
VQRLRRLVGRRSARLAEGRFVVEGAKLIGVALDAGVGVESVYVDPDLIRPGDGVEQVVDRVLAGGGRAFELDKGVLARVAGTVTPQAVLGVVATVDVPLDHLAAAPPDLVVVCVDVRDPGNAGAVLRAAEAAGAGAVVSCGTSVDLFNPKAVRASAGALFLVPVVAGGPAEEVLYMRGRWGLRRLAAEARGGADYASVDLAQPVAVVLGNEAAGVDPGLARHLDGGVTVPMAGRSESLNVATAAAVICFEAARQRRRTAR